MFLVLLITITYWLFFAVWEVETKSSSYTVGLDFIPIFFL